MILQWVATGCYRFYYHARKRATAILTAMSIGGVVRNR